MKIPPAFFLSLFVVFLAGRADAAGSSSTNYAQAASAINAGGRHTGSTNYAFDASVGENGGLASANPNALVAKSGYAGQLYDVNGLTVGALSSFVGEGQTLALNATANLDDGTTLPLNPSAVAWSAQSGPIQSISSGGLLTAQNVTVNTPASAGGTYLGFSGAVSFTIVNTSDDNSFYANDGIDDAWQVYYFGSNNPAGAATADPNHDGHNNLYNYIVGNNPLTISTTTTSSTFSVTISSIPGQPYQTRIVFGPLLSGRTYTLQTSATLPGNWTTLTGATVSDSGSMRTVTDPNSNLDSRTFYRVQISIP